MDPKRTPESIDGVEIRRLVHCADGTVLGAVRLQSDLPATYAALHRQGWTIARSAEDAPDVANQLAIDAVAPDTLLVKRSTDVQLIDSVR